MFDKVPSLGELKDAVEDPSKPIGMRMRAAYFLRQVYSDSKESAMKQRGGGERKEGEAKVEDERSGGVCREVVDALANALRDERHGSLMRHEFAYVLGQIRDDRCCDALEEILIQPGDCVMVRHEAAEALGAIGGTYIRNVAVRRERRPSIRRDPLTVACQPFSFLVCVNFLLSSRHQRNVQKVHFEL